MERWDTWNIIVLLVASLIGVASLVRMMAAARDRRSREVAAELRHERQKQAQQKSSGSQSDERVA